MEAMNVLKSSSEKFVDKLTAEARAAKFDNNLLRLLTNILERMNLYLLRDTPDMADVKAVTGILQHYLPKPNRGLPTYPPAPHNAVLCIADSPRLSLEPGGHIKCERLLCLVTDMYFMFYLPLLIMPSGQIVIGNIRGKFATLKSSNEGARLMDQYPELRRDKNQYIITDESFRILRDILLDASQKVLAHTSIPWKINFTIPLITGLSDDDEYKRITGDKERKFKVEAIDNRPYAAIRSRPRKQTFDHDYVY